MVCNAIKYEWKPNNRTIRKTTDIEDR